MEKVKNKTAIQLNIEIRRLEQQLADYEHWIGKLLNDNKWPAEDGTVHELSKMSNAHVINCLKKIKREKWRLIYQPLFEAEIQYRIQQTQGTIELFLDELAKLTAAL